jgi:hypothetical protein
VGVSRFVARGAAAVCLAVLLFLVGRPIATDDLWWHLALGRLYSDGGPWVRAEPFLFTAPQQSTVPHEWLFQVALYAVHSWLGFQGLRLLHLAAVALILVGVYRAFSRAAGREIPALLALAVFIALAWYRLFQFRPELLSLAALLLLQRWVFEPSAKLSAGRLALAVLLFLVWANAHSVFLVGLALVLAALLGSALEDALRLRLPRTSAAGPEAARRFPSARSRALAGVLVLGALATLLNPRGLAQHLTFFTESATGDIWRIQDDFLPWNPLRPADSPALSGLAWVLADGALVLTLASLAARLRRLWRARDEVALAALDLPGLALAAASLLAMLAAARFHWLVIFPLLYLLRAEQRDSPAASIGLARRDAVFAVGLLAIALALPFAVRLTGFSRETSREAEGYFASPWLAKRYGGAAVRFLDQSGVRGRAFHPFNSGGFLDYWLAPRVATFIDGRLDHVPTPVLDDYLALRRAILRGDWDEMRRLFDTWQVDLVLAPAYGEERYGEPSWIRFLRLMPEWALVFASDDHSVYLRRSEANRRNFERVAAYYGQRGLVFDLEGGFDAAHALARRPAWARRHDLLPDALEEWRAEADSAQPERARRALRALSDFYWRIGAADEQYQIDERLLREPTSDPELVARVLEALIRRREPERALALHASLPAAVQGDPAIVALSALAAQRASVGR